MNDSRKDTCDTCNKPLPVLDVFSGYRVCKKCLAKPLPSEINFKQRMLEEELSADERAFIAAQTKARNIKQARL